MVSNLIMHRITPNIFICDRQKATDFIELEENGIKGLLYLNYETKPDHVLDEYTKLGIQHYCLPVVDEDDKVNFEPYLNRIVKIIKHFDENNARIVVYCETGARLSPIAIVAYIVYVHHMKKDNVNDNASVLSPVLSGIRKKIRNMEIDKNFNDISQQLLRFENQVKEQRRYNEELDNCEENPAVSKIFENE